MNITYARPSVFKGGKTLPQHISNGYSICPKCGKLRYRPALKPDPVAPEDQIPDIPSAPVSVEENAAEQSAPETVEETECEQHDIRQDDSPPHEDGLYGRGLLYFERWWKLRDIDVSVNGSLLSGVPAFIEKNTLRIINKKYSYFIPLEKVDYIRTNDGLESSFKREPFLKPLET